MRSYQGSCLIELHINEYLLMLVCALGGPKWAFDRFYADYLEMISSWNRAKRVFTELEIGFDVVAMQTMAEIGLPSTFTSGGLASMVASTQACRFEVAEFFVSWQGVLTVAYTGFPDALLEVKNCLFITLISMRFSFRLLWKRLALDGWQLRVVVLIWDITSKGFWRSRLLCWLAQKPGCGFLPWFSEGIPRI